MLNGPVYWELLSRGQNITSEVYCNQLDRVQATLRDSKIDSRQICFQQENARPHVSRQTRQKLEELLENKFIHFSKIEINLQRYFNWSIKIYRKGKKTANGEFNIESNINLTNASKAVNQSLAN